MYRNVLPLSLAATLLLAACGPAEPAEVASNQVAQPRVTIQEIAPDGAQKFRLLGEVTAAQSARMTAEARADVAEVLVRPGDRVAEGQVLIRLTSDSAATSAATSAESLGLARQQLAATQASADKSVAAAEAELRRVVTALENTLAQNERSRTQAEEALNAAILSQSLSTESATTNLETAQKNLLKANETTSASESSARTALANASTTAKTTIINAADFLDDVLGVSEQKKESNDAFEPYLGALDSSLKSRAESELRLALAARGSMADSAESVRSALTATEQVLDTVLRLLDKSSESTYFPGGSRSAAYTTVSTYLGSIRGNLASLTAAEAGLNQTLQSNAQQITAAQQAVLAAERNLASTRQESTSGDSQAIRSARAAYESTLAQLKSAEDAARRAVDAASIGLESARQQARVSATSASSALASAAGNQAQAAISLDQLTIRAPFAGRVSAVPVRVGDEVAAGAQLVQVDDPSQLKIIAYLTRAQAEAVGLGDEVKIGQSSADRISAESATVDPTTGKIRVEILHRNQFLTPGQFVELAFTGRFSDSSAIMLPLVAVHLETDRTFVWVVDAENKAVRRDVALGDIVGEQVVITSGLAVGDRVITSGARQFEADGIAVELGE